MRQRGIEIGLSMKREREDVEGGTMQVDLRRRLCMMQTKKGKDT